MIVAKSILAALAILGLAKGYTCGEFRPLVASPMDGCLADDSCFSEAVSTGSQTFEADFTVSPSSTSSYWTYDCHFNSRQLRGSKEEREMQNVCAGCQDPKGAHIVVCKMHGCIRRERDLAFSAMFYSPSLPAFESYVEPDLNLLDDPCWEEVNDNSEQAFADDVRAGMTSSMKDTLQIIIQKYTCECS